MTLKTIVSALGAAVLSMSFFAQTVTAQTAVKPPHQALECTACHTTSVPKTPEKSACLACHGSYAALAEKTATLNPAFNPHSSHRGQEDCASCHGVHKPSQLTCNDCHGFKGAGTDMK